MLSDQAERLRQIAAALRVETKEPTPPAPAKIARTIAVTSGKGGVGKTNVTVNLAIALAACGKRVLVLDADLGLANVDVVLGINPRYHLGQVLAGEKRLSEIITAGPGGIRVIAGGSGLADLLDVSEGDVRRFLAGLHELEQEYDTILIDTGAGLSAAVRYCALAADEILVVTTPEPAAITDAYATVKTLLREDNTAQISLVMNLAADQAEAERLADRLTRVITKFVGVDVPFRCFIPSDPWVRRAIRRQEPFFLAYPAAPATAAITRLAADLAGSTCRSPGSGFSRFIQRLLGRREG